MKSSEIGILTPAEFARLLENASDETLSCWAIGGFTGLRSAVSMHSGILTIQRMHGSKPGSLPTEEPSSL